MILANPPWINARNLSSKNSLDSGNYDNNEEFLKNIFNFASKYIYMHILLRYHISS